jgi:hypothetical protein
MVRQDKNQIIMGFLRDFRGFGKSTKTRAKWLDQQSGVDIVSQYMEGDDQ